MNYTEFKQAIIARAAEAGLTEYDLYYTASASTTVRAYEGDIDKFTDKTAVGACFRCIVDGRTGYSHTQQLSAEEAQRLVEDASSSAGVLDSTGFAAIYTGGGAYQDVPQSGGAVCDVARLKEYAIEIERLAKAADSRVVSVPYAYMSFWRGETALLNSHGVDLVNAQSCCVAVCEAVAEQDGRKYSGMSSRECLTLDGIALPALVDEAAGLAVGSIGGVTPGSGRYPVLFSRRVMCEMLSCFQEVFSADNAQKGLSLLSGKEGERVAAGIVTLIDDPHLPESPGKSPFDDEGVPTVRRTVVDGGVLTTLLYDMQSAAKAGRASTGNGRKSHYAGDINVAPWNFCLRPGDKTPDALIAGLERGVHITELKGLHAGANPSTGEFSLEAKGRMIENGKLSAPAEQFTVAGNFYQLLRDVTGIADDFLLEDGVGSPSVLVSDLAIAGEG